jgi:hypothetical protein
MSARILRNDEYELWDSFVDKSPQGFLFCKTWWLKSLTKDDFKICVIFEGDEIIAGLILPFISTKRIIQTQLTQSLGILFTDLSLNNMRLQKQLTKQKELTNLLILESEKYFKYFKIQFNYNYNFWLPLYWKNYNQTTKYTYIIDYAKYNPDIEFSRLSKGHKWIINQVKNRKELTIVETTDIIEFYKEAEKTYIRQKKVIGYTFETLLQLHNELSVRNNSKIFKIVDEFNNIHAMEYFIYDHNEAYYWLGASDEKYRNSGGHTYLTWYAINYFKNKVSFFNFGGSMLEQVEKNFRNFSAEPVQYFEIYKGKYNFISTFVNKLNRLFK